MAQVELLNVTKQFGTTEVVHGVDLSINDNEFIVLVGPSGCGKSTILRMIAGLETISSGEIKIDGNPINQVPPKDRNVAMVFQNYALYPHMTVFDNIAFSLQMAKEERDTISKKVHKAAEILELIPYLNRKPTALSGGQRQRVAMGRAIVRNPSVFLFDEPLSNLDAQLRTQMRMELKKLHLKMSTTTIYVTHDQIEAMTLADRIVILKDGYIQQIGTPVEVYEQPINRFVASFIGNPPINILPATIKLEGKCSTIIFGNFSLPITLPKSCMNGDEVLIGVRPETIKRTDSLQDQTDSCKIRGDVVVAEILGGRSLLEFTCCGGISMIAELEGRVLTKPGETIDLAIDMAHLLLFDAKTEQAIY